jgi:DNA-directed RNA polymerase specialized sigma24 family protein
MSRFAWDQVKDVELAGRYIMGETPEAIAARLGCTVSAVKTRCSTLGIVRRKLRSDKPVHGN